MKRGSIDSEAIRSLMADWCEQVIPTHLRSLELRSAGFEHYLTAQARLAEEVAAHRFAPRAALLAGPIVEVDERLMATIMRYWFESCNVGRGLVGDTFRALSLHFLGRLVFEELDICAALPSLHAGIIFVANHQTAVESSLFSVVFSALARRTVIALSKAEHQGSWIGVFLRFVSECPDTRIPELILYMNRSDQQSVLQSFRTLVRLVRDENRAALIHVEGTRARAAGVPVGTISSALIDMACESGISLVPVRFSGGLPVEEAERRLDYPVGFGSEDIRVGRPIAAGELQRLPPASRKDFVLERLNRLIPVPETPNAPKPFFERELRQWQEVTSIAEGMLAVLVALAKLPDPSVETASLLRNLAGGGESFEDSPSGRWLRQFVRLARSSGGSPE